MNISYRYHFTRFFSKLSPSAVPTMQQTQVLDSTSLFLHFYIVSSWRRTTLWRKPCWAGSTWHSWDSGRDARTPSRDSGSFRLGRITFSFTSKSVCLVLMEYLSFRSYFEFFIRYRLSHPMETSHNNASNPLNSHHLVPWLVFNMMKTEFVRRPGSNTHLYPVVATRAIVMKLSHWNCTASNVLYRILYRSLL